MHREGKKGQLLIKNVLSSYKKKSLHFLSNFCNSIFLTLLHLFFYLQSKPLMDGFCISILSHTDLVRVDGKGTSEGFSEVQKLDCAVTPQPPISLALHHWNHWNPLSFRLQQQWNPGGAAGELKITHCSITRRILSGEPPGIDFK